MMNEICSQTLRQKPKEFRVGKPIPLEQVIRAHNSRLQQWVDILKGVPPGKMIEVKKDPNTVQHAIWQLVKRGLVPSGEYIKHVEFWAHPEKRRVLIIHLPRDKTERDRILRDLGVKQC